MDTLNSTARIVWLEGPAGLVQPDGPNWQEIADQNRQSMIEHFRARYHLIAEAGLLNGITVHSSQESIGTMCITGPDDRIEELKTYLESTGMGSVTKNFEISVIQ